MGDAPRIRHTYQEWKQIYEAMTGTVITDPGGFRERRGDHTTHTVNETFTAEEFLRRLGRSTVHTPESE